MKVTGENVLHAWFKPRVVDDAMIPSEVRNRSS